ncbi:ABC transporter permease subunit [Brevibacillus choshinensis]|uniref:ABC transporter permease subunit n=1 Tax=Brevibacillus choshinensis TaxID=54911 RepID=UPI002E1E2D44|nr:ABC transporter permease subunit [Brevibacillus choshinensis]MED4583579.1 ABC transporter permease subunit [Brevibacillus choshinensis]
MMQTKEIKSPSPFRTFLKKFGKQRVAVLSLGVVAVIVFAGMLAPWLAPFDPHRPVTDQYQAKGIEVSQMTSTSIPLDLVMSDGSKKSGSELGQVSLESEDRQIASARKTEGSVLVNASGDGSTTILVSRGDLASRFKVVVSDQDDKEVYLSQLIATIPKQSLQPGETVKAEVAGVLTDGSEVKGFDQLIAFAEKDMAVEASKPVSTDGFSNSGFSNSPPSAESRGLSFEAIEPGVVNVSEDGTIQAVGSGIGKIKVAVDGISTILPIAVNVPMSEPVPIRLQPGELQVDLINGYKHQPPSSLHWFGTDHQNRDILSRVLVGTRETLLIGFVSVAIGAAIGTVLGLIAGYYGKWMDGLITRFTDVLLAFPGILLAIAVIALLGPGITNIIFAVAVFTIPIFIRIVRGSALALKEMTYVEAARSIGVRDSVIIMRHIFPGTMSVVMVYLTMRIGTAILIGASLSFLGLGGDITAPEWGAMLSAAKDNSRNLFHPTFFPGLAIVITVLSFNLLGDGLRDALDPKMKD